jgi:hypothetical protein
MLFDSEDVLHAAGHQHFIRHDGFHAIQPSSTV